MRGPSLIALALIVACGGTPRAETAPTSAVTSSPIATAQPTPTATPYPPKAEGFASKVLVEMPRNLGESFTGYIWIARSASGLPGVSATIAEGEAFTGYYDKASARSTGANLLYTTPDLLPLAAGNYTESLRQVTLQLGGRSSAHKHSGIEAVMVLEGSVLVRSGMGTPKALAVGQGFHIIPNTPVQLINIGTGQARTLVYSISPAGQPFTTELEESP